jgi:hypothetical protein
VGRYVCGWCQARANFSQDASFSTTAYAADPLSPGLYVAMTVQKCQGCGLISLAYLVHDSDNDDTRPSAILDLLEGSSGEVRWFPEQATRRDFPDVPVRIADAATEAHHSLSAGRLRAAVLLARAVIEATAKEKGVTRGNLAAKIDEMHSQGLVRQHIREGAHEIRYLGNDMAHGDFVDPVAPEDADLVLALMDEVLVEVFQSPARVARFQARRAAKAAATES